MRFQILDPMNYTCNWLRTRPLHETSVSNTPGLERKRTKHNPEDRRRLFSSNKFRYQSGITFSIHNSFGVSSSVRTVFPSLEHYSPFCYYDLALSRVGNIKLQDFPLFCLGRISTLHTGINVLRVPRGIYSTAKCPKELRPGVFTRICSVPD